MIDWIIKAVKSMRLGYSVELNAARKDRSQFLLGKIETCDDLLRAMNHLKKKMERENVRSKTNDKREA